MPAQSDRPRQMGASYFTFSMSCINVCPPGFSCRGDNWVYIENDRMMGVLFQAASFEDTLSNSALCAILMKKQK
jgi:hypothetical protein